VTLLGASDYVSFGKFFNNDVVLTGALVVGTTTGVILLLFWTVVSLAFNLSFSSTI
jgi:hypothetical protein